MKRTLLFVLALIASGCGPPPDGPYEFYHENGQLNVKGTYVAGERDGPFESYNEDGQLMRKATYKDGRYDGPFEFYYDNGQLGSKGTYKQEPRPEKMGVRVNVNFDGPFESYYEDGQINEKGIYKDGERCGEWLEEGETVTHDPC